MNILVIGNGFDLAHGLPTKYKDFLDFVKQICRIETFCGTVTQFESNEFGYDKFNELDTKVVKYIDNLIREETKPYKAVNDIYKEKQNPIINEIIKLAKDNYWINLLYESKTLREENWVDFESEILREVRFVDLTDDFTEVRVRRKKDKMIDDLNRLIRCLELYLEDCVRNIDKSLLSPDIYDLNIDKVLSFNYTDTYARLYSCKNRNIEYHYIHGKSKIAKEPANNMVLGINEYLDNMQCSTNTNFIEFKKYFQRIHKATGCTYKKWLDEIEKSTDNNVYIFGHSLDITDKDVLKEIITNSNVKTNIFYKDTEQYGKQIANLVKLLNTDNLISMVYSNNPKIKFIMQKTMIDKQNSEWQVINDINSMRRMHMLNNEEIKTLVGRIKQKIDEKDLQYFYNQKNVITVYDVLLANNMCNQNYSDVLLDIAYSLYDETKVTNFRTEDWNIVDYSGEYECNKHVANFIEDINLFNKKKNLDFLELDFTNINVLSNQIDKFIFNDETFNKLFDSLISMFDTTSNTNLIWECIYKLGNKIPTNKWSEFINKKFAEGKENKILRIRLKHIKDTIDEKDFYNNKHEQMHDFDDILDFIR